jgi:Na+/proline symporter
MTDTMTDRGLLFLTSALLTLLSLAAAAWLVATGQAAYVDGIFLVLVCLVVALAFALYMWFLYKRTKQELLPPPPGKKKPAPPSDE